MEIAPEASTAIAVPSAESRFACLTRTKPRLLVSSSARASPSVGEVKVVFVPPGSKFTEPLKPPVTYTLWPSVLSVRLLNAGPPMPLPNGLTTPGATSPLEGSSTM